MTRDDVLDHCGGLPAAVEDYPFGDGLAVFKVGGKIFALIPLAADPPSVSLKCDPDLALHLRDRHQAVRPGYHLNKRHWNTVDLDGSIDDDECREMIDHSYDLVVGRLTRAKRAELFGS
ncbi:MmcQ/YjbR family DNA-binding protein [Mycobacterium sp. URHB0044]|uniref:MmcQ/YjbR family DNA-binding protein n=1 Tax=Mycobacterium sp. URHB0044 TaxID=1380386 RepID=UPI00048B78A2|nr:MmcQ/YjbR family DNA-binding protein [Mycobacterium sp. URHB0044]